jgi:hypothetical protein
MMSLVATNTETFAKPDAGFAASWCVRGYEHQAQRINPITEALDTR